MVRGQGRTGFRTRPCSGVQARGVGLGEWCRLPRRHLCGTPKAFRFHARCRLSDFPLSPSHSRLYLVNCLHSSARRAYLNRFAYGRQRQSLRIRGYYLLCASQILPTPSALRIGARTFLSAWRDRATAKRTRMSTLLRAPEEAGRRTSAPASISMAGTTRPSRSAPSSAQRDGGARAHIAPRGQRGTGAG
jgi:hypothetical protein